MLEELSGSIGSALADAATGALDDAEVARTSALIGSQGAAIANHLNSALASGDQQAVRVELLALRDFFFDLKQVHQQLTDTHKGLATTSAQAEMSSLVNGVENAFRPSGVPGVNSAMDVAMQRIVGDTQGLSAAFTALKNILARNMTAVADTYTAYVQADQDGRSALTAAAGDKLAADWKQVDPQTTFTPTAPTYYV